MSWELKLNHTSETNTGDPKILMDFLKWSITTYPAEHYMAVLWNHGSGWNEDDVYDRAVKVSPAKDRAILYDDESKDFLDNAEMKNVLTSSKIQQRLSLDLRKLNPVQGGLMTECSAPFRQILL